MGGPIVIVSGLPRSGTSLMMQMLQSAGVEVLTDHVRAADVDNPRGYWELEAVKTIKKDASWLPTARGKAFKMVSLLLYDLPAGERYRVIFMERDMDELLLSQERMLSRSNRPAPPRDALKRSYTLHLEKLHEWLRRQPHIEVLRVSYNELVENPQREAQRVSQFLDGAPDARSMAEAVDPSLYRSRRELANVNRVCR